MTASTRSPNRWLEVWIGPDDAADQLLALRSAADGACDLLDPKTGWNPIRRFAGYDAAWRWLNDEAYEPFGSRSAMP